MVNIIHFESDILKGRYCIGYVTKLLLDYEQPSVTVSAYYIVLFPRS